MWISHRQTMKHLAARTIPSVMLVDLYVSRSLLYHLVVELHEQAHNTHDWIDWTRRRHLSFEQWSCTSRRTHSSKHGFLMGVYIHRAT